MASPPSIIWQGFVTNPSLPLPNRHPARLVRREPSCVELQLAMLLDSPYPNLQFDFGDWVWEHSLHVRDPAPPFPLEVSTHRIGFIDRLEFGNWEVHGTPECWDQSSRKSGYYALPVSVPSLTAIKVWPSMNALEEELFNTKFEIRKDIRAL